MPYLQYIEWSSAMSVNVAIFDEHHKKLIGIINELFDHMKKGQGEDIMEKIIDELISYTKYHFLEEEKFLEFHHHESLNEHKKEHTGFIKKVTQIKEKYKSGQKMFISLEVMDFLKDWTINHIQKIDKEYSCLGSIS